ncbi:MAG TPA: cytochrome c [Longimicrobiales bacterium]|nr:cytochrome c [Longimicrobiales bacterium]
MMNRFPTVLAVLVTGAAFLLPGSGISAQEAGEDLTFHRDILPIFQQNCQACHQAGAIAPMELMTYDQVRRYGRILRNRVSERLMPPWHLNPHLGVQEFKNDRSLTEEEIGTIVSWVDAGMPEGNPADAPPPVDWPTGEDWQSAPVLGEPDLVIYTKPFDVPAEGNDLWWRPRVPTGLTEDRYVRATEVLPSFPDGRGVTHHMLVTAVQEQSVGGLLTEWALGKTGEIYQEGTGKLLEAGSEIQFETHYYPNGTPVPQDRVALGIWLYPEDYVPEFPTRLRFFNIAPEGVLAIEPHSKPIYQRQFVMQNPVRIQSFQAHFHLRGKGASMEAIYPNGRTEVLSQIDDFQFNWHNNYIYADDAAPLLPAGTVLKFSMWYDNTEDNPNNPHPGDFVTWGDRAADEMGHFWIGVTDLNEEQYERLVREREAITEGASAGASTAPGGD